jgi:hypothetical protein
MWEAHTQTPPNKDQIKGTYVGYTTFRDTSRCQRPTAQLISGRCPPCAYPAGDAPEDESQIQ